jgi:hypothetical protein
MRTIAPSTMITPTAPASPVSDPANANPQTGQAGRNVSSPVNNLPLPHLGHRHRSDACTSETGASANYSAAI